MLDNKTCLQLISGKFSINSIIFKNFLEYFMKNPGQTLPRSMILSYVWGASSEVEEGNLDNYIYFLRRRLKSVKSSVNLKTVRGIGYQLEVSHV